ncbi:M36 family metallopeptidase [Dokdonella sp.]|uniref:M36 family metallopeptidase n=1 Tax=Dokdonella sp. TaxID=2291710 RepID=UPI001AFE6F2D|nr:M36 family metallopeptidase [Dokdonella sp.]MBO9661430.1 M36 family metallopeptidase [Dokdonella sp.]
MKFAKTGLPRRVLALAVVLVLGADAAYAAERSAAIAPLRLQAQPGWLDDGAADDNAPADPAGDSTGESKSAPAADRAAIVAAARQALGRHGVAGAKSLALDASAAGDVRVHATAQGGYVAQFPQSVDGIEVYGARVNVLMDRDLAVRAITGGSAPAAAVSKASRAAFRRDEAGAVKSAAGVVDGLLAASALREVIRDKAPYRYFELDRSPTFVPSRAARVKPVWYSLESGLAAAYYVEIHGRQPGVARPLARAVIVAADDGRVLSSVDLIRDHQPFAYRVFATPQGLPYSDPYGFTTPHPTGVADGWRPTTLAPMNLVSLRNAGIRTGDPWLPDGATETVGNNIDSYFDADQVDADGYCTGEGTLGDGYHPAEGDLRAPLTGPRTFDYAYDANDSVHDFTQCPPPDYLGQPIPSGSAQLNAKTVQLFYAGNWLHDYFYDLGFDEESGNLQQDNYGRGGVGGDPLWMLSGGAHPYTALAAEGDSELISMGISNYSLTRRDAAAFDFAVLAHEWTHAMMFRLTPPPTVWGGQWGAIGEGSGDFVAQMLNLRAQDRDIYPGKPPFSGAYPGSGAYSNLDYDVAYDPLPPAGSPGNPDNSYYHGVRRYPFSPDFSVNPLTFKNIGIDQPVPPSPPAYDWLSRSLTNAEVHTAGEVWSAAMWECARNILVAKPPARFEQTRRRFLGDVVAGFKLFPADPTYTEARDAMLYAIRADNEADYRRCRAGFAKRGMGAGAIAPDRFSVTLNDVVESFEDRERALSILGSTLVEVSGGDGDGVLDRGESGRLDVTVRNNGFSPLRRVGLRVDAARRDFEFPGGRQSGEIALAPGATATLSLQVRVTSAQGGVELPLGILVRDRQRADARASADALFRVNYDLVRDSMIGAAGVEEAFAADWTLGFGETFFPGYCYQACDLQWRRAEHLGEPAYVIRDDGHVAFDASLEPREFLVSAADPLRITLRHDYLFDRAPGDSMSEPGIGYLQVGVDGGDWQPVDAYLASGPNLFEGRSNGWRSDTLDFGTALAGHRVKFRWIGLASRSWVESSAYWAISSVTIEGAAEPMFSRVVPEPN